MPDIKNYIIANNVKNPFQMRATSPLAVNTPTTDLVMVDAPATPSYVPLESSDSGVRPSSFGAFGELTIDPLAEKSEEEKEKDKLRRQEKRAIRKADRRTARATRGSAATYRDPDSPLNYSTPNPFTPREQGIIGNIYNPSGSDISQFQANQRITKDPTNIRLGDAQMDPTIIDPNPNTIDLNPNTYNQPAIPTEQDMTMTDLETGNQPLDLFGDDLSGGMISPVGLPPGQGMGSTQSGGVTPNTTIDIRRQQNKLRRQNNRANRKAKRISDREYRRTGERPSLFGS